MKRFQLSPLFTGTCICTQTLSPLFTGTCICTQTLTPLFTGTCISTQTLPDLRNFKLGNFRRTQFSKQKIITFFEKRADFYLEGKTAQWDEGNGRTLLNDKTRGGTVMLRCMKFQCVEVKLDSLHIHAELTICMLRHASDFPNSKLLRKLRSHQAKTFPAFNDYLPLISS